MRSRGGFSLQPLEFSLSLNPHWPDLDRVLAAIGQFKRSGKRVRRIPLRAEIIGVNAKRFSVRALKRKVRDYRFSQQFGGHEFARLFGGPGFVEGDLEPEAVRVLDELDGRIEYRVDEGSVLMPGRFGCLQKNITLHPNV